MTVYLELTVYADYFFISGDTFSLTDVSAICHGAMTGWSDGHLVGS